MESITQLYFVIKYQINIRKKLCGTVKLSRLLFGVVFEKGLYQNFSKHI